MSQRRSLVLEIWCGEAAAAGTAFVLDWLAGWLSWLGCSACAGGAGGGGGVAAALRVQSHLNPIWPSGKKWASLAKQNVYISGPRWMLGEL